MRVLMSTQPGRGHLHPMVPLARALAAAGHEVTVACAESFRPAVEAAGLASAAAGLDWVESEAAATLPPAFRDLARNRDEFAFMTRLFADEAARRMVPDLLRLCDRWQPDLLVRNDFELAATLVAERLDLPFATVGIDFYMPPHVWRSLLGSRMARLRRDHGLPAQAPANQLYRYLYLSYTPPSYRLPELALPPVARVLRPVPFDRSAPADPADWRLPEGDGPLVFVTLGTIFNHDAALFRDLMAAVAAAGARAVVATGRSLDPAALGEPPPGVTVVRYVPQSEILPRARAVITHGGFNTVMAALVHGLPLLVVPQSAHHPIHAQRCLALGVGEVLCPGGRFGEFFEAPPPALSVAAAAAALERLVDDGPARRGAQRMAAEIAALPGPEHGVELLETLARERRPLVAAQESARASTWGAAGGADHAG